MGASRAADWISAAVLGRAATRCGPLLFFTSQTRGALLRLDAPDAAPVPVAVGNVSPRAGLLLVDPAGGGAEPWVRGLGMANGVARAPDGTVFASNDFGTHLDRVAPDGAGQVWRVDQAGAICAIARGLRFPSAVAVGRGESPFPAANVYAVTFRGDVVEIPGAVS